MNDVNSKEGKINESIVFNNINITQPRIFDVIIDTDSNSNTSWGLL